jgi:hypothetical protein
MIKLLLKIKNKIETYHFLKNFYENQKIIYLFYINYLNLISFRKQIFLKNPKKSKFLYEILIESNKDELN